MLFGDSFFIELSSTEDGSVVVDLDMLWSEGSVEFESRDDGVLCPFTAIWSPGAKSSAPSMAIPAFVFELLRVCWHCIDD